MFFATSLDPFFVRLLVAHILYVVGRLVEEDLLRLANDDEMHCIIATS